MARSLIALVCILGASSGRPEHRVDSTDIAFGAPQDILASAQHLTDSMLQKRNATGHLSEADADLLTGVIGMIQDSMYASLRSAHQSDQTALTGAAAAVATCNSAIAERQSAEG